MVWTIPTIETIDFFDQGAAKNSGGATGSKQVKNKDGTERFQLKPSIKDAPVKRRLKAGDTDRENFGEVISAIVSRTMLVDTKQSLEYIPELSLVWDKVRGRVAVASRYIKNVLGILDDVVKDRGGRKHTKISFAKAPEQPETGTYYLSGNGEEEKRLRKELTQAIAISALNGNHDVNPGNIILFKDASGKKHIAAIDFGHAFNDLINAPRSLGGEVRNHDNEIIDFINRSHVGGFPTPDESKLWRDYEGLVPSDELIDAFKAIAANDAQKGLNIAKDNFKKLLKNAQGDDALVKHIENSLIAINNAAGCPKIKPGLVIVDQVFENLGEFYKKRQTQMLEAASIMELQRDIDKAINQNKIDLPKFTKSFEKLAKGENSIEWLKTSKGSKPYKGDLEGYIQTRRAVLRKPELPQKLNKTETIYTTLKIASNRLESFLTLQLPSSMRKQSSTTLAHLSPSNSRTNIVFTEKALNKLATTKGPLPPLPPPQKMR